MNTRSRNVNLVVSWAGLLSGNLDDCQTYDDESCEGGIAAVAAYTRNRTNNEPVLTMPKFDKETQFVQVHPMGWSVNRVVYEGQFGYNAFVSPPSLLMQNAEDFDVSTNDLSELQSHSMPLLLTNVFVPPSNSWHPYTEAVHFDSATGLAVMVIYNSGEPMNWPQIDSARGSLNYIADRNVQSGCTKAISLYNQYFVRVEVNGASTEGGDVGPSLSFQNGNRICWIPLILFVDFNPPAFDEFVSTLANHENPPAAIIDLEGNNENYTTPFRVGGSGTPSNNGTWVMSYTIDDDLYYQHRFTLSKDFQSIDKIEMIVEDLELLPPELKDKQYATDISFLRQLANEAQSNNPVIGSSTFMPVMRAGSYRRCEGGECEIGNLFADSLRWKTRSDIAFVASGGLRGDGWPEGNVHLAEIWEALPFPNSICTGTLSGVSLFKLLDYSINIATFEAEDSPNGDRLIQVSGLRIKYNTQLEGERLVGIDVWDSNQEKYEPVDRLRLYKFATDSYVCSGYTPYPELLGAGGTFNIEGEKPGSIQDIGLVQNAVAEYLSQLKEPYNATIQGRLVNNTDALIPLNLIQSEEGCQANTYWVEKKLTCFPCPNSSHVAFSDPRQEFTSVEGSTEEQTGRALLVNREIYNFSVIPRSVPSWMRITGNSRNVTSSFTVGKAEPMLLQPGDSVAFDFRVGDSHLEAGTALGTVSFGLLGDDRNFPGCQYSHNADFDVFIRVLPKQELNQLGSIRFVGLALMGLAMLITVFFAVWVMMNKKARIISTMQPLFLVTICVGVLLIETAIIPISIDDGLASVKACHVACAFIPWSISIGSTVTFSALFSKLWRINKLFHITQFRKTKVSEKDVMGPSIVLFMLNFALMVAWTVTDPWHWERLSVIGEEWNTYGVCKSSGGAGNYLLSTAAVVNVGVLFLTCFQAYKARDISDEFSETKKLFIALYTILQVILIGLPVLLLIDEDNIAAKYFIWVGLIFAICMSMILLIFVPIFLHLRKSVQTRELNTTADRRRTHVSGLNTGSLHNPSTHSHNEIPSRNLSQFRLDSVTWSRNVTHMAPIADEQHGDSSNASEFA